MTQRPLDSLTRMELISKCVSQNAPFHSKSTKADLIRSLLSSPASSQSSAAKHPPLPPPTPLLLPAAPRILSFSQPLGLLDSQSSQQSSSSQSASSSTLASTQPSASARRPSVLLLQPSASSVALSTTPIRPHQPPPPLPQPPQDFHLFLANQHQRYHPARYQDQQKIVFDDEPSPLPSPSSVKSASSFEPPSSSTADREKVQTLERRVVSLESTQASLVLQIEDLQEQLASLRNAMGNHLDIAASKHDPALHREVGPSRWDQRRQPQPDITPIARVLFPHREEFHHNSRHDDNEEEEDEDDELTDDVFQEKSFIKQTERQRGFDPRELSEYLRDYESE